MSSVTVRTEVEVDLADLELEDLEDELEHRRKKAAPSLPQGKSPYELETLIQRYHAEICRQITQGRALTPTEREFWYHVHLKDV